MPAWPPCVGSCHPEQTRARLSLDSPEFTPLSFASNDTDVMVVTRWSATAPATGKNATMDIHHWWRFRDGKIYLYRGTEDTAQTQDILHNP